MFPISEPFNYKVASIGITASVRPGPAHLNSSSRRISPIQDGPLHNWQTMQLFNVFPIYSFILSHSIRELYQASQVSTCDGNQLFLLLHSALRSPPIQLIWMRSGLFGERDGLGSTCVLLQERTCLSTVAHIKHKQRRHMDNMGFSSVQLEGPSASCFPRLPTALHSAISKDGLWQNSLGSKPCGSYRQQWRAKERLDYMVFENTVRERTRRILFSVTSW